MVLAAKDRGAGLPLGVVLEDTPYRLTAEVARSAHAVVYRGEHVKLRTRVMVKALASTLQQGPEAADRMRLEAQAMARLRHPNLVAVIDSGIVHDRLFFVMDDDDEPSLERALGPGGAMPVDEALNLIEGLLDGLAFLHDHGLVHRDLNPDNLLLGRRVDGTRALKILDLGDVKVLGGHAVHRLDPLAMPTADGVVLGSPRCMAPEQAGGGPVDGRSDLYAAACILFRMVTGRDPFAHHTSTAEILAAHLGERPPATNLAAGRVVVGSGIEAVLARALAKRPDERPPSARAFQAELRAARADDATTLHAGLGIGETRTADADRTHALDSTTLAVGQTDETTTAVRAAPPSRPSASPLAEPREAPPSGAPAPRPGSTLAAVGVFLASWLAFALLTVSALVALRGCSAPSTHGKGGPDSGHRLSTR